MSEQMRSIKQDGDAAQQLKEEMTNTNPFDDPPVEYFDDGVRFGTGSEMIAEIKRLREVCENWGNNYQSWVDANKKLEAENRALMEIVGTLPHRDGKPITPGTKLYSFTRDGTVGISWADMQERDEPVVHGDTNGFAPFDFEGFHLTEEALLHAGSVWASDDRNTTPPAHAGGSRASEHKRA